MSRERKEIKVLFVYSSIPPFIRNDLKILEKHFDVESLNITTFKRNLLNVFRLLREILWADVVYVWFAGSIAFFSVSISALLRKKSLVVVGGYDVVYIPEIDYGDLKSLWGRFRVSFILKYASRILPFSNYAKERVLSITKKANIYTIPLACDTSRFKLALKNKENLVITVCFVNESNIKRKGLKTFIETARLLPNMKFAIIGHMEDSVAYLKKISPSNVEFTGCLSDEKLVRWYQRAKVYCQLSYEEGFGVSVIEAMACGCIPLVSLKVRVFKETVGNCGYYVPYGDARMTAKAIKEAFNTSREMGLKARVRVKDLFSLQRREKRLLRVFNYLIAQNEVRNCDEM